jgi:DNA-binding CsgD family transcriptional regulator
VVYTTGVVSFLQPAETTELGIAAAVRELRQPGFTAALAALLQTVGSPDNLVFLVYRSSGTPEVLFSQTRDPTVFAEMERTYLPGAYRLDPYFDLHLTNAVSGAYRLADIAPDAFHRSRYFSEYYEQTTLIDEVAFVINLAPDVTLNLCLGRDRTSERRFSSEDLEACCRLAPVVSALAERHWADLAAAAGPSEDTVDLLIRTTRLWHGISLTVRQAEVAILILRGHSSVSIGLRLGVSPQTVKVFRRQLYSRCNICSQAELFVLMVPMLKDKADGLGQGT